MCCILVRHSACQADQNGSDWIRMDQNAPWPAKWIRLDQNGSYQIMSHQVDQTRSEWIIPDHYPLSRLDWIRVDHTRSWLVKQIRLDHDLSNRSDCIRPSNHHSFSLFTAQWLWDSSPLRRSDYTRIESFKLKLKLITFGIESFKHQLRHMAHHNHQIFG